MDSKYKRDFQAHLKSLTPKKRKAYRLAGLDGPLVSYRGSGCPAGDIAESSLASHHPDIANLIDGRTAESEEEETFHSSCGICRVLSYVKGKSNPSLTIDCVLLVFNLPGYEGESMTTIANRYGVSRAAVSRRCVKITEELRVPPSRAMRSERNREACRQARTKRKAGP